MLSELEYYKTVAYKAVQALNWAYWNESMRKLMAKVEPWELSDHNFEMYNDFVEESDQESEDRTICECDLSPYQLADFMEYENYDPYDDYCSYAEGDIDA